MKNSGLCGVKKLQFTEVPEFRPNVEVEHQTSACEGIEGKLCTREACLTEITANCDLLTATVGVTTSFPLDTAKAACG